MIEENPQIPSNPTPEQPIPDEPDQEDCAGDHDDDCKGRPADRDDDTMVFYPPPKIDLEPKHEVPKPPGPNPDGRRSRDTG